MSQDLIVLAPRRPSQAMLRPALQRHPEALDVIGDLDTGGIEITTASGAGRLLAGPPTPVPLDEAKQVLAETGDLAANRLFGAADVWWLDIEVPAAGGRAGLALARLIADQLARQSGGVVIDPAEHDGSGAGPASAVRPRRGGAGSLR